MPIIVILVLLGTVGIASATGGWIFSGKQVYESGSMTADDIKGWMTLQQVADGLSLPVETVMQLAGAPADGSVTPDTALKDLEGVLPGFETSALREAAAAHLEGGQPSTEGVPTQAPPAVQPAATTPPLATPAPVETAHVPLGEGGGDESGTRPTSTPLPAGQVLPPEEIKGRMSLQEVADLTGVPLNKLLAALNLPPDTRPGTQVKELVDAGSVVEVQTIRDAVAALQQSN
jgi:hypothetical protein